MYEKCVKSLVTEAIAQENAGDVGVFYAKKEALTLPVAGVRFPVQLQQSIASNGIVHRFSEKVNMKISENTQSQQFKRWFGDWQNDPANASKVVNADGTPKVMYHGTNAEFTVFDRSKGKKKFHLNVFGDGNYFTALEQGAARYGENVVPAYLNIKNPYVKADGFITIADQIASEFGIARDSFTGKDVSSILRQKGYDGVVMYDGNGEIVIANAFDSNQIKSATDNVGTFDGNNPDIRYSQRSPQQLLESKENIESGLVFYTGIIYNESIENKEVVIYEKSESSLDHGNCPDVGAADRAAVDYQTFWTAGHRFLRQLRAGDLRFVCRRLGGRPGCVGISGAGVPAGAGSQSGSGSRNYAGKRDICGAAVCDCEEGTGFPHCRLADCIGG